MEDQALSVKELTAKIVYNNSKLQTCIGTGLASNDYTVGLLLDNGELMGKQAELCMLLLVDVALALENLPQVYKLEKPDDTETYNWLSAYVNKIIEKIKDA